MPNPVDGAHRPLLLVFLGLAEGSRRLRKLKLEEVCRMADPLQLSGELLRLPVRFRPLAEAIDRGQQLCQVGSRLRDRFGL